MRIFSQDPNATLDYIVDWSSWLETGDTISTSIWTADIGITTTSPTSTSDTATIWLSGGTVDTLYKITNRITTVGGRTSERSFKVLITDL